MSDNSCWCCIQPLGESNKCAGVCVEQSSLICVLSNIPLLIMDWREPEDRPTTALCYQKGALPLPTMSPDIPLYKSLGYSQLPLPDVWYKSDLLSIVSEALVYHKRRIVRHHVDDKRDEKQKRCAPSDKMLRRRVFVHSLRVTDLDQTSISPLNTARDILKVAALLRTSSGFYMAMSWIHQAPSVNTTKFGMLDTSTLC